jgi:hypothetical protein
MPIAEDLAPSRLDACHRCGQDLGLAYWIEDYDKAVHGRCRDWSRVPFIFEEPLRKLSRQLRGGDRTVAALVRWLEQAKRAWPLRAVEIAERGVELLRGRPN